MMNAIAYVRVSSDSQDGTRQLENLKSIAKDKNWILKRAFSEKVSGTIKSDNRVEFRKMIAYAKENNIKVLMVSEISRIGRKVVDVLLCFEQLHAIGVSVYVQEFNMCSLEPDGKENPVVKMLCQMLAMGAEMENNLRKERQLQGIKLAKLKGTYKGRKVGSINSNEKILTKHKDVVDLIKGSELTLSRIAEITKKSINTIRKVKSLA